MSVTWLRHSPPTAISVKGRKVGVEYRQNMVRVTTDGRAYVYASNSNRIARELEGVTVVDRDGHTEVTGTNPQTGFVETWTFTQVPQAKAGRNR